MKKLLALTSSFALVLVAPVTGSEVAHAQGGSEHVAFCKVYVDLGVYRSIGECVRDNGVLPVRFCQVLKEEGLYPYDFDHETVENQGDCVRWFRQNR
jgi:hypothetical protein